MRIFNRYILLFVWMIAILGMVSEAFAVVTVANGDNVLPSVHSDSKVIRQFQANKSDTIKETTVNRILHSSVATDASNLFNNNNEESDRLWKVRLGIRGFGFYTSRDVDLRTNFATPFMSGFNGFSGGVGVDADILIPRTPLFLRGSFGWMPSFEERGREEDAHINPGLDTFVEFRQTYNSRLSLGYTVLHWNKLEANILVGVEAAHIKVTTVTDELGAGAGPGGELNIFTKDVHRFSPTLSINFHQDIDILNYFDNKNVYIYGGWAGSHQSGITVQGTSGFGFTYNGKVKSGLNNEFYLGMGVKY